MARSEEEIIKSLKSDVKSQDYSVDVEKGPLFNFMIKPIGVTISDNEANIERMERLLSLDITSVSEASTEISAFGNNFKVPRGGGKKEQHLQTFYLYSKPTTTIEIPTGSLVGTSNKTYVYKVLEGRSFYPESSTTYFNSTTNRYELNIMVEAVDYGSSYNLPKGRVNTIVSTLSVDGTVSATDSLVEGSDEETDLEYMAKTEKRFEGLNSGTASGIQYTINTELGISDVLVTKPGDDTFTRKVKRAALDVYVNGTNTSCKVQTITLTEETDKIYFENSPVTSVDYVTVDSESVDFTFEEDTSTDYGGSTKSSDYVSFASKLPIGSYIEIKYYINNDVVSANDIFNELDLYESDVLVRKPRKVYLNLEVVIKTNTVNKKDVQDQALNAVASYPSYTMGEVLYPSNIESLMRINVPNVVSVYVVKHNIDGQTFDIGTVALKANEIIDVSNAVINVI